MDDHDDDKAMIATRLNRVPTSFGTDDATERTRKRKNPKQRNTYDNDRTS